MTEAKKQKDRTPFERLGAAQTLADVRTAADYRFSLGDQERIAFSRAVNKKRAEIWRKNPQKMTEARVRELSDASGGLCRCCGQVTEGGVEPDADGYLCGDCGERGVRGIEMCVMAGDIRLV